MIQCDSIQEIDESFGGTWPFQARYSEAPGFRMHYVDEGSGPETLLLLHGEPTWSFLYRQQIRDWSAQYRVIAVDHMGFGRSETPQDRTYWLQDHIDNLERFVNDLDLTSVTVIMHDFGGPVGMGVACRMPERIKRIVAVNAPTPFGQPDLATRIQANLRDSPWFQWVTKAEREGTLETVLGHLDYNILSTLKLNGFERNAIVTEQWLSAYRAPFQTPADAAGAIGWAKGLVTGNHKFETPYDATRREIRQKPAIAIWGDADKTLHAKHFLPLFSQAFPHGFQHRLDGVGHYSPEDAPSLIGHLVQQFVSST